MHISEQTEPVIYVGSWDPYLVNLICTCICICLAALAAGLTMGMVSLEPFDMKILMEANENDLEDESEKKELMEEKACANKLYPLVNRHHLLLVTLLLLNSIANEALPLFLNQLVSPVTALILSVTAVLVFGEIIPSAIFTGPNQLAVSAALSPFVWVFIYLFYVVSYPCSLLLDHILGKEHKGRYNKAEFRALIKLHDTDARDVEDRLFSATGGYIPGMMPVIGALAQVEGGERPSISTGGAAGLSGSLRESLLPGEMRLATSEGNLTPRVPWGTPGVSGSQESVGAQGQGPAQAGYRGISRQELLIMQGALELERLKVHQVMLPLDQVYMVSSSTVLNQESLQQIVERGHSRIPVYEGHPHNIRGVILVKRLIVLNPDENVVAGSLPLLEPLVVGLECTLLDLLFEFATGRSHMAVVTNDPPRVMQSMRSKTSIPVNVHMAGIVTLEDVIERLIKHEINDETDVSSRLRHFALMQVSAKTAQRASGTGSVPGASSTPGSGSKLRPLNTNGNSAASLAIAGGQGMTSSPSNPSMVIPSMGSASSISAFASAVSEGRVRASGASPGRLSGHSSDATPTSFAVAAVAAATGSPASQLRAPLLKGASPKH